jgi:UDP-N-acetylglucosamine 1-carboxyvinyltransferase
VAKFLIEGGKTLKGTVKPSGNKNEALPALMGCLLTDQPVTLKRVPKIGDVLTVCKILENLGVTAEWLDDETLVLHAKKLNSHAPDEALCGKVRASLLLLGPMLARMGKIELPRPGGDLIGARRIDTHLEGAISLGAKLKFGSEMISGSIKKLKGAEIYLDEPSVTATENLLLMAVLAEGKTTLHNAASEPHVVGLARMLTGMGAKISGIGSNKI